FYPWIDLKKIIGYDIVQIISPDVLFTSYFPRKLFFNILRKFNSKIFLLAAGSDAYFWKYGRQRLRYGPFEDTLKYDLKSSTHPSEKEKYIDFNTFLADSVDGIIPVMPEYEICYYGHKNLLSTIPMPINTEKIKYEKNLVRDKICIFHGLNRYGFKGTRHIEEAFDILKKKYPNDLELIIDGHMPLKDYLELIRKTNILIDQTNFYSVGVNGLYGMALGKVTLGGAETESLDSLGVENSPCINIKPDPLNIVNEIEKLMAKRQEISDIGLKSRKFIEEVHGHRKIAQKYLDTWRLL
ncbi:glycosyltransferase, partial [Alphaproteobacteria bacterium]|nr:glycosyltransferase [Alphaproteobacteria bacterium]